MAKVSGFVTTLKDDNLFLIKLGPGKYVDISYKHLKEAMLTGSAVGGVAYLTVGTSDISSFSMGSTLSLSKATQKSTFSFTNTTSIQDKLFTIVNGSTFSQTVDLSSLGLVSFDLKPQSDVVVEVLAGVARLIRIGAAQTLSSEVVHNSADAVVPGTVQESISNLWTGIDNVEKLVGTLATMYEATLVEITDQTTDVTNIMRNVIRAENGEILSWGNLKILNWYIYKQSSGNPDIGDLV